MTTGIKNSAGTDLDSVFDPYVSGAKPALTNIKNSAGQDLRDRFAPISVGTAAAAQGIKISSGADINTLFAKIGTARYSLPIDGQNFQAYSSGNIGAPSSTINITIAADGTYAVTCNANLTKTTPASGTWLPSGEAASDYQVQYVVTTNSTYTSGGATITNGAAAYSACTTNRTLTFAAQVGQTTAQDKGGNYTVVLNLKKISTGAVQVTTFTCDIEAVGTG